MFSWKTYLEERPDLKKNWNSPFRATLHNYTFGIYERNIVDRIKRHKQWSENYLNSRPDLRKNWNSPFKARLHKILFGFFEKNIVKKINKHKRWSENYLNNRPDLRKNWNSPFRAWVHFRFFRIYEIKVLRKIRRRRNWAQNYLNNRPDLRKNWNTTFRAHLHFYVMRKYDIHIKPKIKSIIPKKVWYHIPKEKRKDLIKEYKPFKRMVKIAPDIFDGSPINIDTLKEPERKEYVLIVPLYHEKKEERLNEFLQCLDLNTEHDRIKKILIFYDNKNIKKNVDSVYKKLQERNVEVIFKHGRLSYKDVFDYTNKNFSGENIILSNADIYFNKTLNKLDNIDITNSIFALTRWNVKKNGKIKLAFLEEYPQGSIVSQDVWIFKTPIKIDFKCDFKTGLNHCDSFLNYHMLKDSNLKILNPCLDIQVCHLHTSEYRSKDLVNLAKRNKQYIEEQAELGNYDAGIKWRYLQQKNTNQEERVSIMVHGLHKSATVFLEVFFERLSNLKNFTPLSPLHNNTTNITPHFIHKNLHGNFCVSPIRSFENVIEDEELKYMDKIYHIYQTRDPRDILVSEYFSFGWIHETKGDIYTSEDEKRDWQKRIQSQTIDEYVLSRSVDLKNRMQPLMQKINNLGDNDIIIKYEDMVLDFKKWIFQCITPFNFKKEEKVANKLFKTYVHLFKVQKKQDNQIKKHRRKIIPGDHKEKLTEDTINKLNEIFKEELKVFNYEK